MQISWMLRKLENKKAQPIRAASVVFSPYLHEYTQCTINQWWKVFAMLV
jgi:hypothetical protein